MKGLLDTGDTLEENEQPPAREAPRSAAPAPARTEKQVSSPGAETFLHRAMMLMHGEKSGPLQAALKDAKTPSAKAIGLVVGSVAEAAERTLQQDGRAENITMPDRLAAIKELVKQALVLRARAGRVVDMSAAQAGLKIALDSYLGALTREGVLNVQSGKPEIDELFGRMRNRQQDMKGRIEMWNNTPKGPTREGPQGGPQGDPQGGRVPTSPGLLGGMQ